MFEDGTILGPVKYDGFIDMMHVPMHYGTLMDDRGFPLAALLHKKGDIAYYTYDLGDQWRHRLVLEDIFQEDDAISLISGKGGCPPEDSNGLEGKGNRSYAEFLEAYKKNPKKMKMKEAVKEVNKHAINYSNPWMGGSITFKPLQFDIVYHRTLLHCMLAGPTVRARKGRMGENRDDKFHESTRGCDCCGSRVKALSKCNACKKASYCSRECQVNHWKTHKVECKKHQKRKKEQA